MILFLFQILDSVPPETTLLIVNALYFKASWSYVFDEDDERKQFTKKDGSKVKIPMLTRISQQQTAAKFNTDLVRNMPFTAVAIPYEVWYINSKAGQKSAEGRFLSKWVYNFWPAKNLCTYQDCLLSNIP